MQKIKVVLATVIAGGLTLFLFFFGLAFMLALFFIMVLVGLFATPNTRKQWRERWGKNWQKRHSSYQQGRSYQRQERVVVEGEYIVKSH